MADDRLSRAADLAKEYTKDFGHLAAVTGRGGSPLTTYYSSGSPTLDFMLGTGGFPDRGFVEVFGPPSIGKTTIFGFGVLRSVQAAGGITAVIATEPDVDEEWMEENGVDPDLNLVLRPDTGEEAFVMLKRLIYKRQVDYVLFDSLAGTSSEKAQGSDKPQAFGNAALISNGLANVLTQSYKNRVGAMFINQIRDSKVSVPGQVAYHSPGGHAVHHYMKIRLQVKPGKERYTVKVPSTETGKGTEDLLVGREIRTIIVKNKAAQELGKQAVFTHFHIKTDEYPFGIDYFSDIFNIAKVSGVLSGSGWLKHEVFPGGKINGAAAAKDFLRDNPKALEKVTADVLAVMQKQEAAAQERAKKVTEKA